MRLQVKVDAIVPRSGQAELDHTEVEHRAERLLAEYLRMWGLRDPSTIAAHCRLWARQSVAEDDRAAYRTQSDSYRSAVEQAMHDINLWLDHLTRLTSADPQAAPLRRGLAGYGIANLDRQAPHGHAGIRDAAAGAGATIAARCAPGCAIRSSDAHAGSAAG